ncbi:hypothetical protein FRB97_008104 [Tulasnella sp. 331]|nr:hypothetical protein FRB97_008104 [Tulasnella sp. 331]KAG8875332.1 hypothetical protein FRB98_007957 [Tulasnella sp. 332]
MATSTSPKIAVIFYSLYGHTNTMAETAVKAAQEDGAEATLLQVPETLPEEALKALGAAPRRTDIPTIDSKDLPNYDGYIFVIPTRYGRSVSQFSQFFDATGGLWAKQALSGKFATIMTSTGTQNGGQETTAFTTLPFLMHHGIMHVPHGYGVPAQLKVEEIKGGSPWGSGTLAGPDGSRQPSVTELEEVSHHAKHFVSVVTQFKRGSERVKAAEAPKEAAAVAEEKKETKSTAPEAAPPVSATHTGTSAAASTTDNASASGGESGAPTKKKKTSIFKKIKEGLKKI